MARPGPLGQAGQTGLRVAAAPELDGHERHPDVTGDVLVGRALAGVQHDAGPGHEPLLARGGADDGLQDGLVGLGDGQPRSGCLCHLPMVGEFDTMLLAISGTRH